MQLATYAKTSLALLYIGFVVLLMSSSSTLNICVAVLCLVWSLCTLKHTAKAIDACTRLGVIFPWYVVIIPVLLFDFWWASAMARMGGFATRELPAGHVDATFQPVTPTSNLQTLSASPIEAIIILVIATFAVKLALPKFAEYEDKKREAECDSSQ